MASIPFDAGLAELGSARGDGDVSSLSRGAQLVLWAVRAIAVGHGDCPALGRMFHLAFGPDADDAMMAFLITVRTIGICARRRLRLHAPGCLGVSADERVLLALLADAQSALVDGDESLVRRRLDDLVEPAAYETLLPALQAAASALEVNGHRLAPVGFEPGRGSTHYTAPRTLH